MSQQLFVERSSAWWVCAALASAIVGCANTDNDHASHSSNAESSAQSNTVNALVASAESTAINCSPEPVVDPFKELVIVDPSVVDDAVRASNASNGHWSFRWLIEQMTPIGVDPADFVQTAISEWSSVSSVNGFGVTPRATGANQILSDWPKTKDGKLDLAQSPFKLLAIVARLDLRDSRKPAGEGRFVFAHMPMRRLPEQGNMTVIFEYTLPVSGYADGSLNATVWARLWHQLSSFERGEQYNAALEATTFLFTSSAWSLFLPDPLIPPENLNGSYLAQFRTSEDTLGLPWEWREFHIASDGFLRVTTTGQTPDTSFNGSQALGDWAQANASALLAGTAIIPTSFLGGQSQTLLTGWQAPGVDESVRHSLAMQTCNGCHNGIENTVNGLNGVKDLFYHVSPASDPGSDGKGTLSQFLLDVEIPRRTTDLKSLLCGGLGDEGGMPSMNARTH